ncbi:MAG: transporter [Gallionellales bacterium 35-53-114]|jgi:predicted permease|nr:MAG: transporter [Gallionellales bacterium 35-53-114]OYZ62121.1 MAG: transporter [Gallionellales bacterium 24-53-125]OZB07318.1 MAG: transporter [Gallionellales bacterium 39-52-133]HQS59836.1 AEC family transporter [Gallionellaceae bacterium]HQS76590.1 AEC family transporter [Gallionellaceae bacterium]
MSNIILLVLCFVAGILLRRARLMPDNAPATLNSFIIHISVPALALLYIRELEFSGDIVLVILMAWLYFGLAAGFFWLVGRYMKFSRGTTGALILTGGLGNTAFFGLPMIEAYYGQQGIATGILIDQTGSFMVLSTLGIIVAGMYSSGRPTTASIVRNILRFPPFIALAVALLLLPLEYPEWLSAVLKRLGDTLAPLALLSVGLQLRLGHLWGNCCSLMIGLGFKLLLAPLFFYVLYVLVLGAHGPAIQVALFEAAMPPMITAVILAQERDLDPELATLMVAVGLPLSFITLTGWWWVLQTV